MNIFQNKITASKTYRLHVNILEARHLEITNANTIVSVNVGGKTKHVDAKTKNTENPYFNRLFRFEFFENLEKFIKRRLEIAVYQKRCFKLIGLCDIELITVWDQPGHQFYHKWAILIDPRQPFSGIKGYLKCNVQILTEGTNQLPLTISSSQIEGNLLMPYQTLNRQYANYTITIYRADGISCIKKIFGKNKEIICKNLYVKISFARKILKTTRTETGEWNQSLNFIEAIPSLFQTITIELWDQKTRNFVGSSILNLKYLDNLPTFGPAFIYLFHSKTAQTTGRILISLICNPIDRNYPGKQISIENVFPCNEQNFPPLETYTTAFVIFQAIFFKKKYFEKCLIRLKHGLKNLEDNYEDTILITNNPNKDHSWFLGITNNNTPVLQTTANWTNSDYRERRNNIIKNLTHELLQKAKNGSDIKNLISEYCQKIVPNNYENNLDIARRKLFLKMSEQLKSEMYQNSNLQNFIKTVLEYTSEPQQSFPDMELILSKNALSKTETTLIKPEDYLYSENDEECGSNCGKLKTFFIYDSKGNDLAILDGILWFGRQKDFPNLSNLLENELAINFQLRVHIYQGKVRAGFDASGLADPFIKILAFGQNRETQIKAQTLDPFWDETLLFSKISLYLKPEFFKTQSFGILFLVLDYDGNNSVELIGRGIVYPKVTLLVENYSPPKLKREIAYNNGEETAEILIAAELIENNEDCENESQINLFSIPNEIRPHFKEFTIEVIFWGIRNLKMSIMPPRPSLLALIDVNGIRLESNIVRAFSSINFQHQLQKAKVLLPEEEGYIPPICVSLYELTTLNHVNFKGSTILPILTPFLTKLKNEIIFKMELEENNGKFVELDQNPDWWTKYYSSKRSKRLIRNLIIYSNELENNFDNFQDFLYKFEMKKGKMSIQEHVADLKCAVRFNTIEENAILTSYPHNHPLDFTIRVYIVAAHHLTPTDVNGRCDPYIKLNLGKLTYSDRKNYIYKETDPIFGKCFELKGTFPWDHTLQISVMDHDICQPDDLIGETFIDLENRYYTKHNASCGISDTFESTGYCQWRDTFQPSEILERICKELQIGLPEYPKYENSTKSNQEKTALQILKNLQKLPSCGFELVPEHVETRTLHHPKKPGREEGKLEMWVDIFPGHINLPPIVDITPREPQNLELRVIVWNTVDVLCTDTSLLTQEKSSDIYIRAWLATSDDSQQTDIHFRSVTGEGNFNWRFIFPFCYSQAEHRIISWKRVAFSNELWKEKLPCVFEVQVWDNDLISDDFIGLLSLDLSNMPKGATSARKCNLKMFDENYPQMSLFKIKRTRGWWPFKTKEAGNLKIAGKIDMELEIMTTDDARKFPAGLGRQGPQPLNEPNRPGTSFIFALNPFKIFKNLIFGEIGKKLQIVAAVVAIFTFLLAGWLALPGILLNRILHNEEE